MSATNAICGDGSPFAVEEVLKALNSCRASPFHAVEGVVRNYLAGLPRLNDLDVTLNGKGNKRPSCGYMTQAGTAICAFRVGEKFNIDKGGFIIIGSHTDSPCFRLRPNAIMQSEGYNLLGCETYGGGLWRTWFDRGLGVAGQVSVKRADKIENVLIDIIEPVAYLPSLCIHLQTFDEVKHAQINKEEHLRPVTHLQSATTVGQNSEKTASDQTKEHTDHTKEQATGKVEQEMMSDALLKRLAAESKCNASDILSWDLSLYDVTNARVAGMEREFIEGQGLDNKASLVSNFKSFVEADLTNSENIIMAVAFDDEEIGSETSKGAKSNLLMSWLQKILSMVVDAAALETPIPIGRYSGLLDQMIPRSLFISCDTSHAVHPNYASKHQPQHKPKMNGGVVLKFSANGRYATTPGISAFIKLIAGQNNIPLQYLSPRNDIPCGSTIGPALSSLTLIPSVDCGMGILAMHSVRELAGKDDFTHLYKFGRAIYESWNLQQIKHA